MLCGSGLSGDLEDGADWVERTWARWDMQGLSIMLVGIGFRSRGFVLKLSRSDIQLW